MFQSFFMGGFECSSHRTRAGVRLDVLAASGHDRHALSDYEALRGQGLRTAREGLRWHLVETAPGRYDFASALPALRAAALTGTQVIWDLCHYGWPDDLDVFGDEFVRRFSGLARAFARLLASEADGPHFIAPVNEISFLAWAAGEVGYIHPCATRQGDRLKAQLVRAALAATEAVWDVLPGARIAHTDPVINVVAASTRPGERREAEAYRLAQYQAWDMIAGRLRPELGGREKYLDMLGVNYYPHNQWIHGSAPFNPAAAIGRGHPAYKPLGLILREVHGRYGRPLLISETGAEGDARAGWLRYVASEAASAARAGVPVAGVCWYPVVDHPGWEDDRHCPNGLWGYPGADGRREIHRPLARELRRQQRRVAAPASRAPRGV